MGAITVRLESLRASSATGLCVNLSSFHPLTLLVGVSGSGKSQVLTYIDSLFKLLMGQSSSDLEDGEYELRFELNHQHYHYLVYIEDHHPVIIRLWCNEALLDAPSDLITQLPSINLMKPINQIRQTNSFTKRFILASNEQKEEILSIFQLIFDSIEDIQVQCTPQSALHLFFKEKSGEWLSIETLSDGMLKTFYYLTEVILSESGSLLLIDEFENVLGLNCMGPLLEQIGAREDLQLILSSHHPYIINNIPSESWQIITREQSTIHAQSAEEFGIGKTRYDAFFELMNRLEFEGVL